MPRQPPQKRATTNARATVPITAAMTRRWFVTAGVRNATEEAAAHIAKLCEAYRTQNSDRFREDDRELQRWIDASHAYLKVLLELPDRLKRAPEVLALLLALGPFVRCPAGRRGRPTDASTHATEMLDDALAGVLARGTTKRARRQIIEEALRACGYGVEKTVENIARADRRRRAKKRT